MRRWGAAYDFMVVLDADSLMTGACIGRLVGAMETKSLASARLQQHGTGGSTPVDDVLEGRSQQLSGPECEVRRSTAKRRACD